MRDSGGGGGNRSCGTCPQRGGAGGLGPIGNLWKDPRMDTEPLGAQVHLWLHARPILTSWPGSPSPLTSLALERKASRMVLTPQHTAEVRSWLAGQSQLMFQSAWAAMKTYHRMVAYTTENDFLTVLEAGSPRSRCWQVAFLLRPRSLACRRLPFCSLLTWPSLCVCPRYLCLSKGPLLERTPVRLG